MITLLAFALASAAPSSGIEFDIGDVDIASLDYIQSYTYCFEGAAMATEKAAQEVRASRFEQCHAKRPGIVADYSGKAGPSAVRKLQRALNIIESAYAKHMGVALPEKR